MRPRAVVALREMLVQGQFRPGERIREVPLAAELAPFKCPREVRLIDGLPRNALGKVVRSELH